MTTTLVILYIVGFLATNIFVGIVFKNDFDNPQHPGCIPGLTWPIFWLWFGFNMVRNKIKKGEWL